jgi:hypothetical protein
MNKHNKKNKMVMNNNNKIIQILQHGNVKMVLV